MTTNIHAVHFEADAKLIEHIQRKMHRLSSLHDRITKVDVFLKLDNIVHQIKDKVAEIRVKLPGHELFVKYTSKSFEESFDAALDALLVQVKRFKEKQSEAA
ncbi:MAG: HPF/RaiA family ribosome-associated protein [Bacteroidetes bacterium]|nr:HPF/RaiA family ribosome-associated protein [Bacteroidota bacterium]